MLSAVSVAVASHLKSQLSKLDAADAEIGPLRVSIHSSCSLLILL